MDKPVSSRQYIVSARLEESFHRFGLKMSGSQHCSGCRKLGFGHSKIIIIEVRGMLVRVLAGTKVRESRRDCDAVAVQRKMNGTLHNLLYV